jgi:hypothetical protein
LSLSCPTALVAMLAYSAGDDIQSLSTTYSFSSLLPIYSVSGVLIASDWASATAPGPILTSLDSASVFPTVDGLYYTGTSTANCNDWTTGSGAFYAGVASFTTSIWLQTASLAGCSAVVTFRYACVCV